MILDKILADKYIEVEAARQQCPLDTVKAAAAIAPSPGDFRSALSRRANNDTQIRLIAEVKKASPSKGLIRPDFDPVAIAKTYEASGASAISVLTDVKYFQGSLDYLREIRKAVSIPLLRKDFIVDSYQIFEARSAGADAILLIVAALPMDKLAEFQQIAADLGMAALVEVHTAEELDTAIAIDAKIIGVNNRNLQTFEVSLATTLTLADKLPEECVLVSESGIFSRGDVEDLLIAGVDAILVGESLMRIPDPGVKVRELIGSYRDDGFSVYVSTERTIDEN